MDRSQSLNAPPYFDGSNYAFWKVRMRAFLYSIDEAVWDAVEIGWTKHEAAKSTWDKAALAASNVHQMLIAKHLMQFFMVCPQMSSIGFLISPLPRKHGRFWRPLMRVQRKLRTQSYRC